MERSADGYQAIKLVLESAYELKQGEHYLDDIEDMDLRYEESEGGLINDDDDDNNSPWPGIDSNPNEPDSEEDEDERFQQFLNAERREEIATLEREISDYNERMANETNHSGRMTLITLISMAERRCSELRELLANSR